MDFTEWRGKAGSALHRLHGTMHKTVKGWYRVKDFIRLIRKAPTKADERALMAKESARIRNALKSADCQSDERWHGLAKLLFMHLHCNGHVIGSLPEQQAIEYMKMVAAASAAGSATTGLTKGRSRLKVKRLGYFGATLMLAAASNYNKSSKKSSGNNTDTVMLLLTNTLKQDLEHGDPIIQSCALGCLAALPNPEMYLELAQVVMDLIEWNPSGTGISIDIVSRRAAVCLSVMVQTVPDIAEMIPEGMLEMLIRQPDEGHQLAASYIIISTSTDRDHDDQSRHRLANMLVRQLATANASPVVTVNRLQALQRLQCGEPEIITSLTAFISSQSTTTASANGTTGYSHVACLMESLKTLTALSFSVESVMLIAGRVAQVLTECGHDPNVKLVALECLYGLYERHQHMEMMLKSVVKAIAKHRAAILQCIRQENDPLIVKLAVNLALAIVIDDKTMSVVLENIIGGVQVDKWRRVDCEQVGERLVRMLIRHTKGSAMDDFVNRTVSVLETFFKDTTTNNGTILTSDESEDNDRQETVVKMIIEKLQFTSARPNLNRSSQLDMAKSPCSKAVLLWLEGRHGRSCDRLSDLVDIVKDDDMLSAYFLMACQQLASRGVSVYVLLSELRQSTTRRHVKEECLFLEKLLHTVPSSDWLLSVEPDLMTQLGESVDDLQIDAQQALANDPRGRLVFTGTGLNVYMKRIPVDADAAADDDDAKGTVQIQVTMVNPLQHAAQPTDSVTMIVAVPKGLQVELSDPRGGPNLAPFSAHCITQDITVKRTSVVDDGAVRLRVRVRYSPACRREELVDTFDVIM